MIQAWWKWLRENIVKAIVLAALTASVTAWLKGVFDATLRDWIPPASEISCVGREWIIDHSPFRKPEPTKKVFRILVATLDHDDAKRTLTEAVWRPFQGEGIDAIETCRVLKIVGAGDRIEDAAAKRGQEWLSQRDADVLVFGEALGGGELLNLHFLPVGGSGDLRQHTFETKSGLLLKVKGDFGEAVAAQLQAVALATVEPTSEASGKYLVETMRSVTGRLEHLIQFPPSWLSAGQLADFQFARGLALKTIGEISGDNKALEEAIAAYREALKQRARDRVPLQWARTQDYLGDALLALGCRESGTARLGEAVEAYRAALAERTRERVPLDWATTQNDLGNALEALGERESGTENLEEAVSAFHEAQKEYTRERLPLNWALAQANLGNALSALGKREGGTGKLEEAVAAYHEALELTRSRDPIDWAGIQNNLGIAFSDLAERDGGTGRLEEAVAAYREALKERTRERVPLDWAVTQYNLGSTLSQLAEREGGMGRLEEAVAAYREALKELTQVRAPLYWARTQTNLGNALFGLAKQESGTSRYEEAVAAYREASKEWTHESSPLDWAMEQSNIGQALWELWQRGNSSAKLEEAVSAYRAALTIRNRQRDPVVWALTQCRLGLALWTLGQRLGDNEKINSGAAACREAQDSLTILLKFRDKLPSAYAHNAGNKMGGLAESFVFIHDYQNALEAADTAMAAFPDLTWVNINRAHALMFLGRLDEARMIFLGHRGEIIKSKELWETSVRTDFESLRRAGLNHPLMDEVEQAFAKP